MRLPVEIGQLVEGCLCVGEELTVAGTEVVLTLTCFSCGNKPVLRALTVADEQMAASTALVGQKLRLVVTKLLLALAVGQLQERCLTDVAQQVVGSDKMVATIDVAVVFDTQGLAAGGGKRT